MLAHQEKAQICGVKVPLYFWFMLSGAICDIFQAVIDYGISLVYFLEWEKATVCWTLSYTLSIWIRHSSHRILVFGDYEGTYIASLLRTYFTYSSSIVISMFSNHIFTSVFLLSHREAWIITCSGLESIIISCSSPAEKGGGEKAQNSPRSLV
jgi:hypothetical protein